MAKKALNVGVIGLGVGQQHALIYHENTHCRLKSICDTDLEKLNKIALTFPDSHQTQDPSEVLSDPEIDLVSIASFDNYHCEQILEAAKYNKHIFVEKPLCLNEIEFQKIDDTLEKNPHIQLSSNFVLRTFPQFKKLREKISSGELGTIYHIEGDYNYGRIHKITSGWRGEIPFYSVMHGGGIHLIDLIKWLTSDTVSEVIANAGRIASKGTQFKYPDTTTSLLNFNSGMTGKVTSNYSSVTPHHHALRVYGTKGTFLHGLTSSLYSLSDDTVEPKILSEEKPIKPTSINKSEILSSFIEQIVSNKSALVSKNEVLACMKVSLAIERSIHTKKWEIAN